MQCLIILAVSIYGVFPAFGLSTTLYLQDENTPIQEVRSTTTDEGARQYTAKFLECINELKRVHVSNSGPHEMIGIRWITVPGYNIDTFPYDKVGDFRVKLDLSQQVLRLDTPEDRNSYTKRPVEAEIHPSYAAACKRSAKFLPVSALALKAKSFDDGLYAAVELAADAGVGGFPKRVDFLQKLLAVVMQKKIDPRERLSAVLLVTALKLGGVNTDIPPTMLQDVEKLEGQFRNDKLQSKPLGFYTWSQELTRIFLRDRMLQAKLDSSQTIALAEILSQDQSLAKAYNRTLNLLERLTNPLAWSDLRQSIETIKAGSERDLKTMVSLFPPSKSHETDLIRKLYGNKRIPDGFNLADEFVDRICSGALDLRPGPDSGWYDYQTYALEPLINLKRMPESRYLSPTTRYEEDLKGLFKALMGLTRETHIKQQFSFPVGARISPKIQLDLDPQLSVEPIATYYLRRARSYRFIRKVLEDSFSSTGLKTVHRITATGPIKLSLFEEIRLMESLFHGAYLVTCDEIGMDAEHESDLGFSPQTDRKIIKEWASTLDSDPDLAKDIRIMVPVFYDIERKMIKVWAVLGAASKPLTVYYKKRPIIKEIRNPQGEAADIESFIINYEGGNYGHVYLVSAEIYVTNLLNREEFRRHCDQHKNQKAILDNLH